MATYRAVSESRKGSERDLQLLKTVSDQKRKDDGSGKREHAGGG